ncbi:hypothetical protein QA584_28005 [Anaerocolumna sp. AGMB13025]|uniref:tetratricopeptide repeat protein n=1 Tax=Anaerocolumna sp. AGMB13025 TaxID=3039116 RepID=UPI00241C0D41|nr:hypothetical protein [Anaerocolumna sp. AGMB13025]WFR57406.1 hypothetical protein QA584_28005 [Anaerocolumna sp. AGMB13025]
MERYENIVKIEEMRKLTDNNQYLKAIKILDTMDVGKIKALTDLSIIAEVYMQNERYDEAMAVLTKIYNKTKTRRILYQLVDLSIKRGSTNEAEEYLDRYIKIAPQDSSRFIFRYSIDKLLGEPYDILIDSLEKLKEYEYYEKWAYELAKVYHKAGMKDKCVRECSDIILWFGEGIYVEKAKLLKGYYVGDINPIHMLKAKEKKEAEMKLGLDKTKDYSAMRSKIDQFLAEGDTEEDSRLSGVDRQLERTTDYISDETSFSGSETAAGESSNSPGLMRIWKEYEDMDSRKEELPHTENIELKEFFKKVARKLEKEIETGDQQEYQDTNDAINEDDKASWNRYHTENEEEAEDAGENKTEYMAEDATENRPEYMAEDAEENRSVYVAEDAGQNKIEYMAEDAAESRPEYIAEDAGQNKTEYMAEDSTENRPEYMAEDAAGNRPEYIAEDAGQNKTEYMAEDATENRPEYITEDAAESRIEYVAEDTAKNKTKSNAKAYAENNAKDGKDSNQPSEEEYKPEIGKDFTQYETTARQEDVNVHRETYVEKPYMEGRFDAIFSEANMNFKKDFGYFIRMDLVRKQIEACLETIVSDYTNVNHMIITGERKSGRTTLAKKISKALYGLNRINTNRVAKIAALKLNSISLESKKDKLVNCSLIIEDAGQLELSAAEQLMSLIQDLHGNIFVILEDKAEEIQKLFQRNIELRDIFNSTINLPEYNISDLLGFAYTYIQNNDYEITGDVKAAFHNEVEKIMNALREENQLEAVMNLARKAKTSADERNKGLLSDMLAAGDLSSEDFLFIKKEDFLWEEIENG